MLRPVTTALIPAFAAFHNDEYQSINRWAEANIDLIKTAAKNPFVWPVVTANAAMITPPTGTEAANIDDLFGFLSVSVGSNLDGGHTIGAFMRPDKRGQGLFTEALELAFAAFERQSMGPIFLACDPGTWE